MVARSTAALRELRSVRPHRGFRRLFVRTEPAVALQKSGKWSVNVGTWLHYHAESFVIPALALLASAALFSVFLIALSKSPGEFFYLIARGGFGTLFSWQNTLVRAAPLILAALCVAIPARMGLVIIGGEGALVISGFSAAA